MSRVAVISLGAGVQSSTMLLMAARGELDGLCAARPVLAVFADTRWEEAGTYEWLGLLRLEGWRGGIEIAETSGGDLRAETVNGAEEGRRSASLPLFTRGADGRAAMARRQCTYEYKIAPVRRLLRQRGFGPARAVEQWIGISREEAPERMKDSGVKWLSSRWPLVELEMSRRDCEGWLSEHGYPVPPKSSCIGCPFHGDAHWREMKLGRPEAFADAVDFDRRTRQMPGMRGETFLHRSLTPLGEVDFRSAEDRGQLALEFNLECEGMCGI
jgi:hypothetical protein